jgi:hypothetical protein
MQTLAGDQLTALLLDGVLSQYRAVVPALLRALMSRPADDEAINLAYVEYQVGKETDVAISNAQERTRQALQVADSHWRDYTAALARKARFAELAARQEGRSR